jgi:hypothetical protein
MVLSILSPTLNSSSGMVNFPSSKTANSIFFHKNWNSARYCLSFLQNEKEEAHFSVQKLPAAH